MKNILFFLLLSINIFSLEAQDCPNNFTIHNQNDVDNFMIQYPNCTVIEGYIFIEDDSTSPPITNLVGLSNIDSIGSLRIEGTESLTNLSDLEEISYIGNFSIRNNTLKNLFPADNLPSIDFLYLQENYQLDGSAFEMLNRLNDGLLIRDMPNLNYDFFSELNFVGGNVQLETGNENWNSPYAVGGFENLEYIGGNLIIIGTSNLDTISGFNKLVTIRGNLEFEAPKLSTFLGFNSLDTLNTDFDLSQTELKVLEGFNNIKHINGSLNLSRTFLDKLNGFDKLSTISGSLNFNEIFNNTSFDLNGLNQLESIGGDLLINETFGINKIGGFNKLSNIRSISINKNSSLGNINGFNKLSNIGSISINENSSLGNINGFNLLDSIHGNLTLESNASLTSIEGFNSISYANEINLINLFGLDSLPKFNALTRVNNNFNITNLFNIKSLTGFGELIYLGGDLILNSCNELQTFDACHKLETGGIKVENNYKLETINGFENLVEAKDIEFNKNRFLSILPSFNLVKKIKGNAVFIRTNSNDLPSFNNLSKIGGNLILESNENITNIIQFEFIESIRNISIIDNNNLSDIPAFSNLLIADNINIRSNNLVQINSFRNLRKCSSLSLTGELLISIDGFYQLDTINGKSSSLGLFVSGSSLEKISGFNNLKIINGSFRLSSCPKLNSIKTFNDLLWVRSLSINRTGLDSINFLNSLYFIASHQFLGWGGIYISENPNLISIDNIPLTDMRSELVITDNPLLINIDGFKNINPDYLVSINQKGIDINIQNNKSLSKCNIHSICGLLTTPDASLIIENNGVGCNDISEIECIKGFADGFVFYDTNGNGIKDTLEQGIDNQKVLVTPTNYELITYNKGKFVVGNINNDPITVSPILNQNWVITSDSLSYSFDNTFAKDYNFIFGLQNSNPNHAMRINLSAGPTRCNRPVKAKIAYENTGSFIETAVVELILDPLIELDSSIPTSSSSQSNSYLYNFTMQPFETGEIDLTLHMPDETHTGEQLNITVAVYDETTTIDDAYDVFEYNPIVLCSYDPNDKMVSPPGVQSSNYTLHDEKLTYTIRFQNTGNAEAIDITIKDIIEKNLDLETFRIMNSSFPVNTTLENREVTFEFLNINLPDSTANEAESHGFVTYEILPINGLDENTKVENTARIIFDFNPSIITNTTLNTMVSMIPSSTNDIDHQQIHLYPNPTNSILNINTDSNIDHVVLYDLSGNLMKEIKGFNLYQINLIEIKQGIYIIGISIDKEIKYFRIVKI